MPRNHQNEARIPRRSSRPSEGPLHPRGVAVERDLAAASPRVSDQNGVPAAVPHVDLLLTEVHESIERLREAHAAMTVLRERVEAESAWLAGVFAAVEGAPK